MYLSTQLGTAQLGLAQLGQFKASFALTIAGGSQSVFPVVATAFVSGGRVSGGIPLEAAEYISAQLGTAQLGLAQLGQYERQFPLGINASGEAPLAVVATALSSGARISGGAVALTIAGAGRPPQPVTATAFFAGAALKTPGLVSNKRAEGYSWWYLEHPLARRLILEGLHDPAE
jgi:hypothetical protein